MMAPRSGTAVAVLLGLWFGCATALPACQDVAEVRWAWVGGVGPHEAVVKARLSCMPASPDAVKVTVGAHGRPPRRVSADAVGAFGMARIQLRDLQPATRFSYRVELLGGSVEGGFRTHGSLGEPQSFAFGVASCADNHSESVVFDVIRQHDPLFFLHTGDLHYGNVVQNDPAAFHAMYDQVMASTRQRRFFAAVALVYMWDDHDFGPNNSHQGAPGRESSIRAFREAVPTYPLPAFDEPQAAARARPRQPSIFFAFTVGRVRFIVTDTSASKVPGKTALGAEQLQWLKRELEIAAETHERVFWVSTMPWITPHSKWGAFGAERQEIVDHVQRLGLARKLILLSGDAHMLALDDGSFSYGGFPVFQAAALDAKPTCKGGPYSHGIFPGRGQYGWVQVTDRGEGQPVCVALSGRRVDLSSGAERELLHFDTCNSSANSPRHPYYPSPPWLEKIWKRVKKQVIPRLYRGDEIMVFFDSFTVSMGMVAGEAAAPALLGLVALLATRWLPLEFLRPRRRA